MRLIQTELFGDYNLGLFSAASDRLLLLGVSPGRKKESEMSEVLGVDVERASVAGSELVGIFCAMNSNGIVLPRIASGAEIEGTRDRLGGLGMSVGVLESRFTAAGNLILCNDRGALVSNLLSERDVGTVEETLGVEASRGMVAGLDSVGSCGVATNRGCLLHRDAGDEEIDRVQQALGVEADIGTANFGSPFVGSCAVANSNGVAAGKGTTGPEANRMMEALGLL